MPYKSFHKSHKSHKTWLHHPLARISVALAVLNLLLVALLLGGGLPGPILFNVSLTFPDWFVLFIIGVIVWLALEAFVKEVPSPIPPRPTPPSAVAPSSDADGLLRKNQVLPVTTVTTSPELPDFLSDACVTCGRSVNPGTSHCQYCIDHYR